MFEQRKNQDTQLSSTQRERLVIPVNEPLLDGNEKAYLAECIDTGWISSEGPFISRLEVGVAQRLGRRYAIAVCNGTAALELAVAALGLGRGDEVILPTFTIISCATAVVRAGATPVVVDSDPDTWNVDVSRIEEKITPRTRAVMVVHTYGLPTDMSPILALAKKYRLRIIEDAAEAIGQTYRGKPCGAFGDISALSFYANKHITTGEGGMVLTDDPALSERCRSLRNLCFQRRRYVHEDLGWNFRMSNLQAAVGLAQLERLGEFLKRKSAIGARYTQLLKSVRQFQLPMATTDYADNIYWVYGVVLADEVQFDADEAIRRLEKAGVSCRPFFWPIHEQPVFRRMGFFHSDSHLVAERLARRGFYLPSGLALRDDQIDCVVDVCRGLVID
jgi:perosamine synthetase